MFEGFEHVLEAGDPAGDIGDDLSPGDVLSPGDMWTLDNAMQVLNITKRTALRNLKNGTLRGYKVPGTYGQEWRIYPDDKAGDLSPPSLTPGDHQRSPGATDLLNELRRQIGELKTENQSLQQDLQAATWRNGYLESQVKNQEAQIKLLTDSQHKQGWWPRLKSWLTSDR
jgi:hypothetical protein